MLNLFDYLTEEDNKKIKDYIYAYGSHDYIGNKEYLKYWAESKKKLFHLLGGNLIYKVPIEIAKTEDEMADELRHLINKHKFTNLLYKEIEDIFDKPEYEDFGWDIPYNLKGINAGILLTNRYGKSVKMKAPGARTTLQLDPDMKPMKAYQKIINYFGLSDEIKKEFEDFRIKHSMILNDRILKGNLCFSIHPLDFITMSDNANNWSSCMSWTSDGCYHLGTVEMMNSNNVVCVYLEAKIPFEYGEEDRKNTWNSKRWRQLFYCTKEIIVSGKSYPYYNEDLTKKALSILRDLAKDNWNHEYEYGIERYYDMIYIGSKYRMDNNRMWIQHHRTKKHNIIFDSNAMYNDMFNAQNYSYWCVRNKVKKNTIINYSGKSPCVCCMNDVKEEREVDDFCESAYNERFDNTGRVICSDCREQYICDVCGETKIEKTLMITTSSKRKHPYRVCKKCLENMRYCPFCGKKFMYSEDGYSRKFFLKVEDIPADEPIPMKEIKNAIKGDNSGRIVRISGCHNCLREKITFDRANIEDNSLSYRYAFSTKVFDKKEVTKYLKENLRKVKLDEIEEEEVLDII